MSLHNEYGLTKYNRHPVIFNVAREQLGKPRKIMSFGCSFGCECITLANMFPEAIIHGVEIDGTRRAEAVRIHTHPRIVYSGTPTGKDYDAIFCMSVLCKHPQTDQVNNCSNLYPFSNFVFETANLASRVRPKGVLVFFNTTYFFIDTEAVEEFTAIDIPEASGENVLKFDPDGSRTERSNKQYVFRKKG